MKLTILSFCLFGLNPYAESRYEPNWASLDSRPLPDWYDQSKIGIFLHWGLYSAPGYGSEWMWAYWKGGDKNITNFMNQNFKPNFTYQDFGPMLTAEFFDPDLWADIFQASGAKYVVLTSKHHEGYTMWPSQYAWNWNAHDLGSGRDLLGDLANSVRKKVGMRFGLYYSLYEWYHPLYNLDKKNHFTTKYFIESKMIPEMKSLINIYKPEVLWVDGDWEASDTYFNSTDFLAWLYNDSPVKDEIAVNDRWGINMPCQHGGYYTCKDRFNPGVLQKHKWENAMTIDLDSWGYRRTTQMNQIMKIEEAITTLVQTVSCGGNLLINVGPTGDGRIIPIFEERLRQLGSWLKVNGEAVYYSTPWKSQNDSLAPDVWYTQRADLSSIYAFVLKWPKDSKLDLGSLVLDSNSSVAMFGVSAPVSWKMISSQVLRINLPKITPDQDPSKWAWVLKISNPDDGENVPAI